MKLLHVSDWHLGRTALGLPRDGDFDAVVAQIVGIARDAKPDAILHTGDLFDVVRPAVTDMARGFRALQALAKVAPVVVLAGNHDSPALLRLFGVIANGFSGGDGAAVASRILFVDKARPPSDGGNIDLPAASGTQRIRIAPLPFVHANRFLDAFRSSRQRPATTPTICVTSRLSCTAGFSTGTTRPATFSCSPRTSTSRGRCRAGPSAHSRLL